MHGNSGCLGGLNKHTLTPMVDKSSKRQKNQGQPVKKSRFSEDFWTPSTCDMDNSAVQSQGSMSSISTSNQTLDAAGSASIPPEYVNHGLLLWNQSRQCWIGNTKFARQAQQVREPKWSWNATYESLLGSNKPFPQAIPLSETVDFLVDIWEQEGLYD